MKKLGYLLFIAAIIFNLELCTAQTSNVLIYDPNANATADIKAAITKSVSENKHVLIQVGGNWCPWCIKLHNLFQSNQKIDSLIKAYYILIHVNYSKENKNLQVLKELDFPQRFGFPVFVVLDSKGKRIHTQDTGLLESGNGYDVNKVVSFLKNWSITALDPKNY